MSESASQLATEEALRRYPLNHQVDDPFGETGVAESDPYGYDDNARHAFEAGAEWQRAQPPIRQTSFAPPEGLCGIDGCVYTPHDGPHSWEHRNAGSI